MAIKSKQGSYYSTTYEVHCDKCSNYEVFEDIDSFHGLLEAMKERGWQSVKTDKGWDNLCPVCGEGE